MKSTLYVLAFAAMLPSAALAAPALSGDQILARAGNSAGLHSFSAPVQFDVQMHKPIGIKSSAQGIVSFNAPTQATLTITKMPSVLSHFFKSSYSIDLAPQVWPAKYTVESVSETQRQGAGIYVLRAVPKSDPSVDHVVFEVAQNSYAPLSATWSYKDGSSVQLRMVVSQTSGYALPQTETVTVSMPQYSLDATVNYGSYSLK
jgi:hypothetical protein